MAHAALMRQLRGHIDLRRKELRAKTMEEYQELMREEGQLFRSTLQFSNAEFQNHIARERRHITSGDLNRMCAHRAERRKEKDARDSRLRVLRQQGQEPPRYNYTATLDCWQGARPASAKTAFPTKKLRALAKKKNAKAVQEKEKAGGHAAFNRTVPRSKLDPTAKKHARRFVDFYDVRIEPFPAAKTTAKWCRAMGFDLDPHLTLPGQKRPRPQTAPLAGSVAMSLRRGSAPPSPRRRAASPRGRLDNPDDANSVASIPDVRADTEPDGL